MQLTLFYGSSSSPHLRFELSDTTAAETKHTGELVMHTADEKQKARSQWEGKTSHPFAFCLVCFQLPSASLNLYTVRSTLSLCDSNSAVWHINTVKQRMVCLKNLEISCTHKHIFHVVHIYLTFIEIKYRKVGNWFTEAITDCRNVCVTHTNPGKLHPRNFTVQSFAGASSKYAMLSHGFLEERQILPSSFLMRFFRNNFTFIHCQLTTNVSHCYASSKKYTWQPRTDIEKIWRCVLVNTIVD